MQVNAMDKMCTKNELGLHLECTWNELGITLECPWSELGNDLGMNLVSTWNAPLEQCTVIVANMQRTKNFLKSV